MDQKTPLPKLASFIRQTLRRSATDAWDVGHALQLAKDRLGPGKFDHWLATNTPLSRPTAYRYIAVHREFDRAKITGTSLKALYAILGGSAGKQDQDADTRTR